MAALTLDMLRKAKDTLDANNDVYQSPTIILNPEAYKKLMEMQRLTDLWKNLPDFIKKQRWLKYNLQNKTQKHKRLPLPK